LIGGMGLVAAGYPTYVLHPITLLAPVPLLLALLVLDDARLASPAWVVWVLALMAWTVLLYLAMAGTTRGLAYSLSMYAPFAVLSFRIRRPEPVALVFAVATTTLVSARILASWFNAGAKWVPWQVYEGNELASRLNILLPLVLVALLALPAARRRERLLLLLLFAAGVTTIVLTQERAGLGVLAVLVLIGLARNQRKALVGVGVAALSGWLLASRSIVAALEHLRFVNFVPSNASRPEIWSAALDASRESAWLGVGPGNSVDALREVDVVHAHNGLVQSALEAGWPGALSYAALSIYVIVLALRLLRQDGQDTLWALSLLAYVGFSVISAPIQRPDSTLVLVLVVMAAREHVHRRGARCAA
jgi:O-antigen ligase